MIINIGPFQPIRITDRDILNSGGMDFLGRPVFSDVTLKWKEKRIQFLDAIVTVTEGFNIVKTVLAGRSGTVKEYISANDYEVKIIASLNSEKPYAYPANDLQDLISLLNSGEQIEVISEYIALFGIQYLVCERAMFRQQSGIQNKQGVELNFLSDKDVQLIIEEEN